MAFMETLIKNGQYDINLEYHGYITAKIWDEYHSNCIKNEKFHLALPYESFPFSDAALELVISIPNFTATHAITYTNYLIGHNYHFCSLKIRVHVFDVIFIIPHDAHNFPFSETSFVCFIRKREIVKAYAFHSDKIYEKYDTQH